MVGDQHANGKEAQRIGFGLHLSYQSMTEDQLVGAIQNILTKPKFSAIAQEYGSAVMDQKEHPLDRAVWWLEHTMRHPTIYQGKNPVHKLNTIQYFQLDVISFLTFLVSFLFYLVYSLVKCCCCRTAKTKTD